MSADQCTASRHGTRAAYVADCRCPQALAENTAYAAYRKRRTAQAEFGAAPPFQVDVQQAREALATALEAGWTLRRIEAHTRLRRDQLSRIKGGTTRPVRRVRWATYEILRDLASTPPAIPGGTLVDGTCTHRRLQALIAIGWPKSEIARRLGHGRALQIHADQVTARNAAKVAALYHELAYVPGPSQRARQYAAARGWLSAMHWDDRIDDLTFHPFLTPLEDDTSPTDELAPRRRQDTLLEDIAWLAADGMSDELIARRLRISLAYIDKLRERAAS